MRYNWSRMSMYRCVVTVLLLHLQLVSSFPGTAPSDVLCTFEPTDTNCRMQNVKLWKRGLPRDLPGYGPRLPTKDHTYGTEAGHVFYCHGAYGDHHAIAKIDFGLAIWDLRSESKCIEFFYYKNYNYQSAYIYVGANLGRFTRIIKQTPANITTEWTRFYTPLPRGNYSVTIGARIENYFSIDDIRVYDCPDEHQGSSVPEEIKECDFDTSNCDYNENIYNKLQWTRGEDSDGLYVKTEPWESHTSGDEAEIFETSTIVVPNALPPYCLEYNYGKIGMSNPYGLFSLYNRAPNGASRAALVTEDFSNPDLSYSEDEWGLYILPPGNLSLSIVYTLKGASEGGPKVNGVKLYECPFMEPNKMLPSEIRTNFKCDFEVDTCHISSPDAINVETYRRQGEDSTKGNGFYLFLNNTLRRINTVAFQSNPQFCVEFFFFTSNTSSALEVSYTGESNVILWDISDDSSWKINQWNRIFLNLTYGESIMVNFQTNGLTEVRLDDITIDYCGKIDNRYIPSRPTVLPPNTPSSKPGQSSTFKPTITTTKTTTKTSTTKLPPTISEELQCFSCEHQLSQPNDLCIRSPDQVSMLKSCGKNGYCFTKRIENTQGVVLEFERDCSHVKQNYCRREEDYTACYSTCRTDLCNDGDGVVVTTTPVSLSVTVHKHANALHLICCSFIMLYFTLLTFI